MADHRSSLHGNNNEYIGALYARYLKNLGRVPQDWADFFANLPPEETDSFMVEHNGPDWSTNGNGKGRALNDMVGGGGVGGVTDTSLSDFSDIDDPLGLDSAEAQSYNGHDSGVGVSPDRVLRMIREISATRGGGLQGIDPRQATVDSLRAMNVIRSYRILGHLAADLDPLGLRPPVEHPELDPAYFGFKPDEHGRPIFIDFALGREVATLRDIIERCKRIYCGTVGFEYMHVSNLSERIWIREQIEMNWSRLHPTKTERVKILQRIAKAVLFEDFLHRKFTGAKRFGLEGGEALVPLMEEVIDHCATQNIEEVVVGMAHRGRLNILANVMDKPYASIFAEFRGKMAMPEELGSGDVKYHLGYSNDRMIRGNKVHCSLMPNPSHLECVNTVVLGKVRAKQDQINDRQRARVLGVLLHGDAAFIGQGVVAEAMLLSQLNGYKTGGTLHIAVNNQIGFTTQPSDSRSSPYCSDMAKTIEAPVFHVNGNDPDAVVQATRLACEYRARYKKDVVIDLWCFRRRGHNESDEPMFTQPIMYRKIASMPTVKDVYAEKLVGEGVVTPQIVEDIEKKQLAKLDEELASVDREAAANRQDWLGGRWSSIRRVERWDRSTVGGVSLDLLHEIGLKITTPPPHLNVDRRILKSLEAKRQVFTDKSGKTLVDWGLGEALALGSLMCEGHPVRFSGEDTVRGTFSHRHAGWVDQDTSERYIPLEHLRKDQSPFEIFDSPLSEFGLLGFEYGYAMTEPDTLVIWEAQFGDFANGAQVIIDQYIASGETKWMRMSGLVMLLPHGYEGQGPEHSSARLERYLQLSASNNWLVANITSPANYFHALRQQVKRDFRKPLVQMSPKSILRHKHCTSWLSDFGPKMHFRRVLWDDADAALENRREGFDALVPDDKIERVILCSGKVYFDLAEARHEAGLRHVYILRLEQLYPFPDDSLKTELKRFKNARFIWCQEEGRNAGAYTYLDHQLEDILADIGHYDRVTIVCRDASSSPATGSAYRHQREQKSIVEAALKGDFAPPRRSK